MLRCGQPGAAAVCLDVCNGYKGITERGQHEYRYYMAGERGSGACSNYRCSMQTRLHMPTRAARVWRASALSTAPNPSLRPTPWKRHGLQVQRDRLSLHRGERVRPSYPQPTCLTCLPWCAWHRHRRNVVR